MKKRLSRERIKFDIQDKIQVPWFPRSTEDINKFSLSQIALLERDMNDPYITDIEFNKRKQKIVDISLNYKTGDIIPNIEYT